MMTTKEFVVGTPDPLLQPEVRLSQGFLTSTASNP